VETSLFCVVNLGQKWCSYVT